MTATTDHTTASQRTFYPSDYARLSAALRRARHVKCQPYTAKDQDGQDKVGALAMAMAQVLADDAPGSFDLEKFLAGTQMPASGHESDEDEPGEDESAI